MQLLGQIDAIEASQGLATLAVGSKFAEIRRRATETLPRHRDPRGGPDMLIVMLQDKIKYEVKKVAGPGSPGELYVEEEAERQANLRPAADAVRAVHAGRYIQSEMRTASARAGPSRALSIR